MNVTKPDSSAAEWFQNVMPEIVIDSENDISASINKRGNLVDRCQNVPNDASVNYLSCKQNLDDADSGIHESNENLATKILSANRHSTRLSLRDHKKHMNLSELRSYSVSCLSSQCTTNRETLGINPTELCRNCSMRDYSKNRWETFTEEPIIEQTVIPRANVKANHYPNYESGKQNFQQTFCRINVLLVGMKILLGSTMTGLGLFLISVSSSITIKDCAFWASGPLLFSGLMDIKILKWKPRLHGEGRRRNAVLMLCGLLSFICSILCFLTSIFTGLHGNWISGHSDNCYTEENPTQRVQSPCCYDLKFDIKTNSSKKNITCVCLEEMKEDKSKDAITMRYNGLTCRYVFSAVKDYLILQCALMAIGAGVSIWLLQMAVHRIISNYSPVLRNSMAGGVNDDQNCLRQSPIIPLKLKCSSTVENSPALVNTVLDKLDQASHFRQ